MQETEANIGQKLPTYLRCFGRSMFTNTGEISTTRPELCPAIKARAVLQLDGQ